MSIELPSVRTYMTVPLHSVAPDDPVSLARNSMRHRGIRHLPVLAGGRLVGVVSERDLNLASALTAAQLTQVRVADVMSGDPYWVSPETPLVQVAREMAENKLGCAVVVAGGTVLGILTTADVLAAFIEAVEGARPVEPRPDGPGNPRAD